MVTLPDLPYEYDALAPVISETIMRLHHSKHHQAYVDKFNEAIREHGDLAERSLVDILRNLDVLPNDIRVTVQNNGGGHYNHSLFWQCMSPVGGGGPKGPLAGALIAKYGSIGDFEQKFSSAALSLFGSGWVWLMPDLEIISLPNQDTPMAQGLAEPLMGLDVWEHAYYLDYKNKREQYITSWWDVVNWPFVESRYS